VHCAELSNDGLLYVCDRPNDRIQVFKPDGTFVKEVFIAKNTLGDGSVWEIALSKDPQQKYIYLANGSNEKVYIIARESMEILTSFGDDGRQPAGSMPCIASPQIPQATSSPPERTAANASRSSCTRAWLPSPRKIRALSGRRHPRTSDPTTLFTYWSVGH
jgi:hypothetical protein